MSGLLDTNALALPYLLEARLLKASGRRTDGMEGGGGRVDEVEELACSLWAGALRHGHGAEGEERARWMR